MNQFRNLETEKKKRNEKEINNNAFDNAVSKRRGGVQKTKSEIKVYNLNENPFLFIKEYDQKTMKSLDNCVAYPNIIIKN